jgi:hypothetical protein
MTQIAGKEQFKALIAETVRSRIELRSLRFDSIEWIDARSSVAQRAVGCN